VTFVTVLRWEHQSILLADLHVSQSSGPMAKPVVTPDDQRRRGRVAVPAATLIPELDDLRPLVYRTNRTGLPLKLFG
jgi:hypothetical protein